MKFILLIFTIVLSTNSFCSKLVSAPYKTKYQSFNEYYNKHYTEDKLEVSAGKDLFYMKRKGVYSNKKAILIVPGWAEPIIRYKELLYDLRGTNLPIIGFDHPSQGNSYRNLPDSGKTHITSYDEYLTGIDLIFKNLLEQYKEVVVISHSMGSNIVIEYLKKRKDAFTKVVMYSPLFRINTQIFSKESAITIAGKVSKTRLNTSYTIPKWILNSVRHSYNINGATHSKDRFYARFEFATDDERRIMSIGPTWEWANIAMTANAKLVNSFNELSLNSEFLLFQSGKDNVVTEEEQNLFCKSVKCKLIRYDESGHWIHQEIDSIRSQVIKQTKEFLEI